jgi:hypothetical protein|uniref:Uncharacterized protein n=1 Tax=Zea mays TaxID=4577 RepID=A0A804QV62_MAIZE
MGLMVHIEDSHLTRIQPHAVGDAVYWETTTSSALEDYRAVEGVMIAHSGRSAVTLFRFGEAAMSHTKTRMEEAWSIEEPRRWRSTSPACPRTASSRRPTSSPVQSARHACCHRPSSAPRPAQDLEEALVWERVERQQRQLPLLLGRPHELGRRGDRGRGHQRALPLLHGAAGEEPGQLSRHRDQAQTDGRVCV